MEAVSISFANAEDLKNIQALGGMHAKKEHKEYDPTLNLRWSAGPRGKKFLEDSIKSKDSCVLVAKSGNEAVGYLLASLAERNNHRTLKKQAELDSMFVLDKFRSRGVGRRLVKTFLEWAKMKGADNASVSVFTKNWRAAAFCKKCGFRDYDRTMEIRI